MIYDASELFEGYESSIFNAINDLILAKTICLEPSSFGVQPISQFPFFCNAYKLLTNARIHIRHTAVVGKYELID